MKEHKRGGSVCGVIAVCGVGRSAGSWAELLIVVPTLYFCIIDEEEEEEEDGGGGGVGNEESDIEGDGDVEGEG